MKDAVGFAFNLPEIPGLGATGGRRGATSRTARARTSATSRAGAGVRRRRPTSCPRCRAMTTTFRANVPQVYVDVDRASRQGARREPRRTSSAPCRRSCRTLYINDFNLYGRTYRVQAEAQPQFRQTPEDIGRLYVRGRDDEMMPVSSLVRTEFRSGPTQLLRFNGFTSALFTGDAQAGPELAARCMTEIDQLVAEQFAPQGVGIGYSGQSFQERAGERAGGAGLRARPGDRLPGARGAVRELVDSVRGAASACRSACSARCSASGSAACRATSTSRSA